MAEIVGYFGSIIKSKIREAPCPSVGSLTARSISRLCMNENSEASISASRLFVETRLTNYELVSEEAICGRCNNCSIVLGHTPFLRNKGSGKNSSHKAPRNCLDGSVLSELCRSSKQEQHPGPTNACRIPQGFAYNPTPIWQQLMQPYKRAIGC